MLATGCISNVDQTEDEKLFSEEEIKSIPSRNILHIKVEANNRRLAEDRQSIPAVPNTRTHQVIVLYIKHVGKNRLRMDRCVMTGPKNECLRVANDMKEKKKEDGILKEDRRLLVLINPISGNRRALDIYRNQVEPLLKACEIATDVIVSTYRGKLGEVASTHSLDSYDGVVAIGGDGSLNEVFNGILRRVMAESSCDAEDIHTELMPITLPLGLIPAGKTMLLNVVSIHDQTKLLHYAFLVIHIGFVGDLMNIVDKNRWMRSARFVVAPQIAILKRRVMPAEMILYAPDIAHAHTDRAWSIYVRQRSTTDVDREPMTKHHPMFASGRLISQSDLLTVLEFPHSETSVDSLTSPPAMLSGNAMSASLWSSSSLRRSTLNGDMYNIFFSITQLMTERGTLRPSLGRDVMCLQVAMKSSLPDFLTYLTRLRDNTPGMDVPGYVHCSQVNAVQLTLAKKSGKAETWYINSDGEIIPFTSQTCYFRLHPRIMTFFGSRTE